MKGGLFDIAGRLALVTGSSGGLGQFFAEMLAEQGAEVVLASRRQDKLEAVAEGIRAGGGAAHCVEMDVTSDSSVATAFAEIEQACGRPCDLIVNNSGLGQNSFALDTSDEEWTRLIDTNLSGVFRVAKHGANALIRADLPGAIINISSICGQRASRTLAAYSASKAGVDHLTRVMALELARNRIRVNALAPGYFTTPLNRDFLESEAGEKLRAKIPMKRFGRYENLAGPMLLLASAAGDFMTGTTVTVDGGHTLTQL